MKNILNPKDHLYVDKNQRVRSRYLWTNGTSFAITKIGYDANGNWSYWLRPFNRKRSIKIQHMAMAGAGHLTKLTKENLSNIGRTGDVEINRTIQRAIDYYRQYHEKK